MPNFRDITIISDEVYEYITYDGFKHVSIASLAPELRENILVVNAFSKAYSMTGWRVGFAAGNKKVIDAMTAHQSQFTSNVCSIAQYAASKAYDDKGEFPRYMQEQFAKRLELVYQAVKEMPGLSLGVKPKGAFFAFIQIDGILGKKSESGVITCGQDFANYLLDKYDVVVVQGEAFGCASAIRISFALDENSLKKGLERMKQAVLSLS